jgi:hypothetical protein
VTKVVVVIVGEGKKDGKQASGRGGDTEQICDEPV